MEAMLNGRRDHHDWKALARDLGMLNIFDFFPPPFSWKMYTCSGYPSSGAMRWTFLFLMDLIYCVADIQATRRPASRRSNNAPPRNRRDRPGTSSATGPNARIRPLRIWSRRCATSADTTWRWSSCRSSRNRRLVRLPPYRERQHAVATNPSASSNLFYFQLLSIFMHIFMGENMEYLVHKYIASTPSHFLFHRPTHFYFPFQNVRFVHITTTKVSLSTFSCWGFGLGV